MARAEIQNCSEIIWPLDQVATYYYSAYLQKNLAVSGSDQSESKILKFELILPMYIL